METTVLAPLAPIEERLALVTTFDLEPIKFKLVNSKGWSRERTEQQTEEYRRFLHLKLRFPGDTIVCSEAVDEVWHCHILDTDKYTEDCERLFGFYLHHFPYFGMRGEEDAADLLRCFESSQRLYEEEFGEKPPPLAGAGCNSGPGPPACSGNPVEPLVQLPELTSASCDGNGTGAPKCGSSVSSRVRPKLSQL